MGGARRPVVARAPVAVNVGIARQPRAFRILGKGRGGGERAAEQQSHVDTTAVQNSGFHRGHIVALL